MDNKMKNNFINISNTHIDFTEGESKTALDLKLKHERLEDRADDTINAMMYVVADMLKCIYSQKKHSPKNREC